jgi:tetratricopeptide (TPR) repeat protein
LREQYEKGVAALQRDNLDYALIILTKVLEQEPAFFSCREALRAAQFKKAGAKGGFFKKMFGVASKSPLVTKGQIELRHNPLDALRTAEQILNKDPYNIGGHKLLADAALAAELPRTAVLSLEIAWKHSPDRAVALRLGKALAQAGEVARAESVLSELAQTFPQDTVIAQTLKDIAAKRTLTEGGYEGLSDGKGSYRDVLRDKTQATSLEQEHREVKTVDVATRLLGENEKRLEQEPDNLRLLRSCAELCTEKGEYDQALAYYQRMVDTEGGAEPSLEKAITETSLRKLDASIQAVDPEDPDGEERLVNLRAERAAYLLERAQQLVEKYPNDLHFRFELGERWFEAGKLLEAIQAFQKAQANPHLKTRSLYYLGQCFAQRGIYDLAARSLQNAIAEKAVFDDEKKDLVYALGKVFEQMNKPNEAIDQFKLIFEVDIGYKDVAGKVDAFYSSQQS